MIKKDLFTEAEITTVIPAVTKPLVSGSISVTMGSRERYRSLYSNSDWFNGCEYYLINDKDGCVVIKKCYLDIPKKAQKFPKTKHFSFVSNIPLGKYKFDSEDSNEDVLFIYYC